MLAIDTDSRFYMLFWGLRKGNIQNFHKQFLEKFSRHMTALTNMAEQDETVLAITMSLFFNHHLEYKFVQRGDRSVQAHINDVFFSLQYIHYSFVDDVPTEEELLFID
ncbi:hypothetical protein Lbir_1332 [Legionella birminghamensis]|uniref:DUF6933 domain-containing protein n=1 Tax=Legionella birminghamensis TaxID=28083 RepID=A0A378ICC2_9GAMM|nr:hypothetical protein [Legionella birminghamensis]KTC72557.1 hypothetical protein Lbir_1332 [Legionella birminghamensis]STX32829.1 Uncharacterised protein [Legionella birminghamensis]